MKKTCWIITEGMAGTENQCIGVAQALGIEPVVMRISLRQPWKTLSPYLGFENTLTFTPALALPWPDLLLTSGRKAIAASRFIKRQSKGNTITVHIQDPRISQHHFNLVAVPAHDPMRGANVIVTTAAPNKITPELLKSEADHFPHLLDMESPKVAVLIGGNSKAYSMTENTCRDLAHRLKEVKANLMITCSRRTGAQNETILREVLDTPPNYFWNGTGRNPYLAMLYAADMILVTADSVSMLSESCTTGKPVYMIPLNGGARRISLLHKNLMDRGALRLFDPERLTSYGYEPLNDAKIVAEEIKKRFKLFTDCF